MASPNSNYTDLIASTLEYMGDEVVDAVTGNNAATAWMKAHDGYKVVEGGRKIIEPVAYAANSNGGYYSGYDQLPLRRAAGRSSSPWPTPRTRTAATTAGTISSR